MKEKMSILARLENDASAASLKGGLYSVTEQPGEQMPSRSGQRRLKVKISNTNSIGFTKQNRDKS